MGLTIKELIPIGERILRDAGVPDFVYDAEALLSFVTGFDKKKIFMNWTYEVDDARNESYFDFIGRRQDGEPLQYITGEQYFMGLRIGVNPSVLIPRPETELLAEKAIAWLKAHESAKSVLDLCTGSGALALSIEKACPRVKVTASDISAKALDTAKQNAHDLGLAGRIDFIQSDLFLSIKSGTFGKKFDLIVTNPPYIRTGDLPGLQREVRDHEPMQALDGGTDGLDFYKRIAQESRAYLRKDGLLMAEIGADQAQDVCAIFKEAGFANAEIFQDLAGLDRILVLYQNPRKNS